MTKLSSRSWSTGQAPAALTQFDADRAVAHVDRDQVPFRPARCGGPDVSASLTPLSPLRPLRLAATNATPRAPHFTSETRTRASPTTRWRASPERAHVTCKPQERHRGKWTRGSCGIPRGGLVHNHVDGAGSGRRCKPSQGTGSSPPLRSCARCRRHGAPVVVPPRNDEA